MENINVGDLTKMGLDYFMAVQEAKAIMCQFKNSPSLMNILESRLFIRLGLFDLDSRSNKVIIGV